MENKMMPVNYNGERILTTEQLAEIYQTSMDRIKQNFSNNKSRFKEGKHYYYLEGSKLKAFKNQVAKNDLVNPHTSQLYLWTERGADRHCKILETDKAWEQFDNLEETYFKVKEVKQLSAKEELKLHYEVLEEHGEEIKTLKHDVTDIKENIPLFNVECKELQGLVRKIGMKSLGGHEAPAYKDNSLRGKIYSDIQRQLKREFGVRRYEAIKRCQLDKAKDVIERYRVPAILQDKIALKNNQLHM